MGSDWAGFTVVCMASGPSLTREDALLVQNWRESAENRRVIVTNTTFKMAPWADVLFAMDSRWWLKHGREAEAEFAGERLTVARGASPGAKKVDLPFSGNSGACSIMLSKVRGASRVILLGYDCQYTGGKRHWHGDHPKGLGNCVSLPHFPGQFEQLLRYIGGLDVVNASRATVLDLWPRKPLEECLC